MGPRIFARNLFCIERTAAATNVNAPVVKCYLYDTLLELIDALLHVGHLHFLLAQRAALFRHNQPQRLHRLCHVIQHTLLAFKLARVNRHSCGCRCSWHRRARTRRRAGWRCPVMLLLLLVCHLNIRWTRTRLMLLLMLLLL